MGVAVFDYAAWAARYPELTGPNGVQEPLAQALFAEAGIYLDNTDGSIVCDVPTRLALLNMIVAHLAASEGWSSNGKNPSGFVGRITDASEGSVRVKVADIVASGTEQWWLQTPYGFSFWTATAQYRTMRYVPGPDRSFEPYGGFYGVRDQWPR
jgi:hypothetical protein